jgi:hypothetical protein
LAEDAKDKNPMTNAQKNVIYAICFIIYAVVMTSLILFLKSMSLDYCLGALSGFLFAVGLFFLISRDFRNL